MAMEMVVIMVVVIVETQRVPQTLGFKEIILGLSNRKGMLGMRNFLDNEVVKEVLPRELKIMADFEQLKLGKQHWCPMWSHVCFASIQSMLKFYLILVHCTRSFLSLELRT